LAIQPDDQQILRRCVQEHENLNFCHTSAPAAASNQGNRFDNGTDTREPTPLVWMGKHHCKVKKEIEIVGPCALMAE
jgi:hypothetical protein